MAVVLRELRRVSPRQNMTSSSKSSKRPEQARWRAGSIMCVSATPTTFNSDGLGWSSDEYFTEV